MNILIYVIASIYFKKFWNILMQRQCTVACFIYWTFSIYWTSTSTQSVYCEGLTIVSIILNVYSELSCMRDVTIYWASSTILINILNTITFPAVYLKFLLHTAQISFYYIIIFSTAFSFSSSFGCFFEDNIFKSFSFKNFFYFVKFFCLLSDSTIFLLNFPNFFSFISLEIPFRCPPILF